MVLFPLGAAAGVDSLEMTGDEYSQGAEWGLLVTCAVLLSPAGQPIPN